MPRCFGCGNSITSYNPPVTVRDRTFHSHCAERAVWFDVQVGDLVVTLETKMDFRVEGVLRVNTSGSFAVGKDERWETVYNALGRRIRGSGPERLVRIATTEDVTRFENRKANEKAHAEAAARQREQAEAKNLAIETALIRLLTEKAPELVSAQGFTLNASRWAGDRKWEVTLYLPDSFVDGVALEA